jgi:succinate dehydrogenase / fumarate reductase membrane anchor subunit
MPPVARPLSPHLQVYRWQIQMVTSILHNATVLVAFLIAACWHAKLGLQVVIEDYVHAPLLAGAAHLANIFACALLAIAGVFAVLRIALGA